MWSVRIAAPIMTTVRHVTAGKRKVMMMPERIPGYDDWKTAAESERDKPVKHCTCCDEPIFEGDVYYDKGLGEILCEGCNEAGRSIA